MEINLSFEQEEFIKLALEGNNILVDACIGSGKTTSIQMLCDKYSKEKRILYLTYSKLLKFDAKQKIKSSNTSVFSFHGFAYYMLKQNGINSSNDNAIKLYLANQIIPLKYDVLIIDEYQDIDTEMSNLLLSIKKQNPNIQIIAVGDMDQKIFDKTTLDIKEFITSFLDSHIKLSFTFSYRISNNHAAMLGRIWNKEINGINDECKIEYKDASQALKFLIEQNPSEILCLGSRNGLMTRVLNILEEVATHKWNKKTVYASIKDVDQNVKPNSDTAIFTTYDSAKGLEKPICLVFDFSEQYWNLRLNHLDSKYEILRNVFCVAASRGKNHIIFVHSQFENPLTEEILRISNNNKDKKSQNTYLISEMFDHKYEEDLTKLYSYLEIKEVETANNLIIDIKTNDDLIDLSPCIGVYQEALYFNQYKIENEINKYLEVENEKYWIDYYKKFNANNNRSINELILFFIALQTKQQRYIKQTNIEFVNEFEKLAINNRLKTLFTKDENVQVSCHIAFEKDKNNLEIFAIGLADVLMDNVVYELKFVNELKNTHFLQTAAYMLALGLQKGMLWNVRNNQLFEIRIKNKDEFKKYIAYTITKHRYLIDKNIELENNNDSMLDTKNELSNSSNSNDLIDNSKTVTLYTKFNDIDTSNSNIENEFNFAVIDVETNFFDKVISIGVVIAKSNDFKVVDTNYWIIKENSKFPAIYSKSLLGPLCRYDHYTGYDIETYDLAIEKLIDFLNKYNVKHWFSYTSFDYRHLPKLSNIFQYHDISIVAKNKNFNDFIPDYFETFRNGALKRGYGAESIYRLVTKNDEYFETHNGLIDAIDELIIMYALELDIESFIQNKRLKKKRGDIDKYIETNFSINLILNKIKNKNSNNIKYSNRNTNETNLLVYNRLKDGYIDTKDSNVSDESNNKRYLDDTNLKQKENNYINTSKINFPIQKKTSPKNPHINIKSKKKLSKNTKNDLIKLIIVIPIAVIVLIIFLAIHYSRK
ncbi:Hypothetical protein MAU_5750 [Metamycoplasma auris 15026]|uniref:DNA helicase n=1 Tax=Metamycoplasma auris 15026 TaxID=1188233 RepID=N9TQS2_9BACT|nr:AAA family ATPase [Metamycoplasma auris]ENY68499.1 Hypothetical protein MAU_5750 [Metamycoplasma auris 15026]